MKGDNRDRPATPEKRNVSSPDPTPWKDKLNVEYLKHTLVRKRIRTEMGSEMLECPVDAFLADYSPFLPNDALVDAAIQVLARQQLLVTDEHAGPLFWRDFEDEPSSGAMETQVFKPLEDIAHAFDDELGQLHGRRRHFFYRDCPYDDFKSEIPGSNFRVDACFTGNPNHVRNKHVICAETAVVAEFKRFAKDFEDNREKLVSAASQIMNDDPCRMWTYGITVENTKMAVWYFSRSHSVKTASFDFTKDFRTFVRVFLSFAYATREQMGYDPTVHRIKDKGSQYVYEIPTKNGTRYFKTIQLLAHRRVLCITGRKTRVWKAIEVKGFEGEAINEELNGGKEVALKDVWLDNGSRTEKQKLEDIFECLRKVREETYEWAPSSLRSKLKTAFENGSYRSYFMEIECDSFDLGQSKPTSDHAIPVPEILQFRGEGDLMDDDKVLVTGDGGKEKSVDDPNMLEDSNQTTGYTRITEDDLKEATHLKAHLTLKKRSYAVKRQYRLVYNEIGESLEHVKTLDTAFTALMDTYIALVLMYLAGWMHRDVSAGNIIAVRKPGGKLGGKLSDLEYAKHYGDENSSSDPKTGTAFFMPLEIHIGTAFERAPTMLSDSLTKFEIDPFDGLLPVDQNLFCHTKTTQSPPQRAKYRFQHDLESLWWVALYLLIYRIVHPPGRELSDKVFTPSHVPTGARRELFVVREAVQWALERSLHPSLQLESIVRPMNAIPALLFQSYFMDEPVDPKALSGLYHDVFRFLALLVVTIRTRAQDITFYLSLVFKSRKRVLSKTSMKGRGDDEYEKEEEPSSDEAVPRKKKKASTSTGDCG